MNFINHLLDSKNEQGETPLDIARKNNNKVFNEFFERKPYTVLSEIKGSQRLIQEKISPKRCNLM